MRIAYIDHSFHEKTESTKFLPAILETEAEILLLWDESWKTGFVDRSLVANLVEFRPDLVVFFQVLWPAPLLAELGIHRAVFLPMYDSDFALKTKDWAAYRQHHFLSFSGVLAESIAAGGASVEKLTFFPESPNAPKKISRTGNLRGFYWHRSNRIGWDVVSKLASETSWKSFYVHDTPDPGSGNVVISKVDRATYGVETSSWFKTREGFQERLRESDIFFAPRLREGIGMGFLEAMANGCCVVAPDLPTHNEYIQHGENGFLYKPGSPEALDFSTVSEMGAKARETCLVGRKNWEDSIPGMLDWILDSAGNVDLGRMQGRVCRIPAGDRGIDIRGSLMKRIWRRLQKVYRS